MFKYLRSWYYLYKWVRFNKPPPCKYLVMRKDGIIEFNFSKRREKNGRK